MSEVKKHHRSVLNYVYHHVAAIRITLVVLALFIIKLRKEYCYLLHIK